MDDAEVYEAIGRLVAEWARYDNRLTAIGLEIGVAPASANNERPLRRDIRAHFADHRPDSLEALDQAIRIARAPEDLWRDLITGFSSVVATPDGPGVRLLDAGTVANPPASMDEDGLILPTRRPRREASLTEINTAIQTLQNARRLLETVSDFGSRGR